MKILVHGLVTKFIYMKIVVHGLVTKFKDVSTYKEVKNVKKLVTHAMVAISV